MFGHQQPPELTIVRMDDSLVRFRALFSEDTNMAAMRLGSPCAAIFGTSMLSVLGEGPSCQWKDARELVIALGAPPRPTAAIVPMENPYCSCKR